MANPAATTGQIAVGDVDVFSVTRRRRQRCRATLTPTGNNLHATVTIKNSLGQTVASGSPLVRDRLDRVGRGDGRRPAPTPSRSHRRDG